MIVIDYNGSVLANFSAELPFAVEPSTGYAYVYWGWYGKWTVAVVDPMSGATVRGPWSYDLGGDWGGPGVLGKGVFYMVSGHWPSGTGVCCYNPIVTVASATTGEVLANHSLPEGMVHLLAVDPSGGWLLGRWEGLGASATFRINLTSWTYDPFGPWPYGFAFSPEGEAVYICGTAGGIGYSPDYSHSLLAYWVANGSLRSTGYCREGPIAVNPVTGVVATSDGYLSTGGPILGRIALNKTCTDPGWTSSPFPFTDLAWTGDGRALIGFAVVGSDEHASDCHREIGVWRGRPYLVPQPHLVGPKVNQVSLQTVSTSGLNGTTLRAWIDGQPWPHIGHASMVGSITVNVSGVPDGTHRLRVSGWDILGQPVDWTVQFDVDRSAPRITVVSSLVTDTSPYELRGTVYDVTRVSVRVNGVPATLNGTEWSVDLGLIIGNNPFRVDAEDAVKLRSNVTGIVRQWPQHDRIVSNATYRVSVAVPPGWLVSMGSLAGTSLNLVLVEPSEDGIASYFSVQTLASAYANGTYEYVQELARYQADLLHDFGNTIVEYVHPDTIDGRVAASFEIVGSSLGYAARSVVTIVASEEWHMAYMLTMNVPFTRASANPETRAWILEGFHIEASSPPLAPAPQWTDWWPSLGMVPIATVAAVAIAWLVMFHGSHNRLRRSRLL